MEPHARPVEKPANALGAFIAEVERVVNPKTAFAIDCASYDRATLKCVPTLPYWSDWPIRRRMGPRAQCPHWCKCYQPRKSET